MVRGGSPREVAVAQRSTVRRLMWEYGRTHAAEAGVRLRNTPAPLYQLLTLCVLFSVRIKADIAVAAARELFAAGMRTPRAMAAAPWQDLVDALGRAHYRRYDESTATALGAGAEFVLDRYGGDLRRLRAAADGDPARLRELLQEVPRIGPVGADIFCREAQGVWPELRPAFDARARHAAGALGLPNTPEGLARLVSADDLPRLAAALVRVELARAADGLHATA
ncbi:endonuclease [Streptomyces sp. NPDC020412]|uniref:endonuclease n=1 Tax=Streptomyces sp. NPDC020412 TaxID=3365073 RepID=UPI0037A87FD5